MKLSTVLLCCIAWSISIIAAYHIGSQRPHIATAASGLSIRKDLSKISGDSTPLLQINFAADKNTPVKVPLNEVIPQSSETIREQLSHAFSRPTVDPSRAHLIHNLLAELAEAEPIAALELATQIESPLDNHRARLSILKVWGRNAPAAAAEWLSSLSEYDPIITHASASIIKEWTRYDLSSSAEWLNSLPISPDLDRAVINYTNRVVEEDPEIAMTWAKSIEDKDSRTLAIEHVGRIWKQQEVDSFESYNRKSMLFKNQE